MCLCSWLRSESVAVSQQWPGQRLSNSLCLTLDLCLMNHLLTCRPVECRCNTVVQSLVASVKITKATWFGDLSHHLCCEGWVSVAVQRCYRHSVSSPDLCSVSKFPGRGRKLLERDWARVFVYRAEGLWYDWNHRCRLSPLCCAAGGAQRMNCTPH